MTRKNVFFMGLNDFNRQRLQSIRNADSYEFHGLLDPAEFLETYDFPVEDMLRRAREQLDRFKADTGQSIDAIAGYMDFPVSTMLPLLCKEYGTPSASLESLLKCEHKYWSRLVQREIVPEHIPEFRVFDPFDYDAFAKVELEFPFWVKPIKSSGSKLGFRIENREQFDEALRRIREEVHLIAEPFSYLLDQAELPAEVAEIPGHACVAESIIGGWQVTLEGYSFRGDVRSYGIVDSVRYENGVSFFRYEYPSSLPDGVREQMKEITAKVIPHIGFDNSAFNVEYYWNREHDKIWLLEINTRIAQSHSDLFEKVDGCSNHEITVSIATGHDPDFPYREGRFGKAAKFFWRVFDGDARVTRVPTEAEIEEVGERFPGTHVKPQVHAGMQLSELLEQDSYSYAICYVFVGADKQKGLLNKYYEIQHMLPFEFAPVDA